MEYRIFGKTNEKVSVLGFGCMRLPLLPGGDPTKIDEEFATDLIHYAIDQGVNYMDTAYPYHGTGMDSAGQAELFLAKALKGGYREKVKIATKLPSWLIQTRKDMDKYLNEQLERLETDSIDFYLVHALNKGVWPKLKEAGIAEFLDQAIKDGRIKHAGFSFHDELSLFKEIVDFYDWSFCQIQYNYLDEELQAGTSGLEYAAAKGLGIAIMEPLRGGKLATSIPSEVQQAFEAANASRTPADFALRWLWNNPKVSVVLSGMNTLEQLTENLNSANESDQPLTDQELEAIHKAKDIFQSRTKVGCTGCSYCMPCPQGVDIPRNFMLYNNLHMFGQEKGYEGLATGKKASNCIACGLCEVHCPQGIEIREELEHVVRGFER